MSVNDPVVINFTKPENIKKTKKSFSDMASSIGCLEIKKEMVNHPNHYQTTKGIEAIDVMIAFTEGMNNVESICTSNMIKYTCRWKKKNGIEDLKKVKWYADKLIKHLEGKNESK